MRITTTSRDQERTYLCPVDVPVSVLGGKWKLLIAYFLLQQTRRNGELRRLLPGISQKMLTQQLRELESDGVVERTVHEQVPPRVEYAIADNERARLEPVVRALFDWGISWTRDRGGTFHGADTDDPHDSACSIAGPDASSPQPSAAQVKQPGRRDTH